MVNGADTGYRPGNDRGLKKDFPTICREVLFDSGPAVFAGFL